MAVDANRSDLVFGIVGTGAMGGGIAQIAAQAGVRVILMDSRPGAAAQARDAIARALGKLAEKGKVTEDAVTRAMGCLFVADALADLAPCHVVVEAIVEDLAVKQALMRDLETVVGDDCLLATNTSSLAVTAIAAACKSPGRVGGFHFFNPVPLMKVVEVIDGALTEPWVGDTLTTLGRRIGHQPVRAKDTPGFIVNHAGRGYGTEALKLVGEGVADFPQVDRILRQAAGFRMGPFELLDLTGLDVSHPVMESIYEQCYHEPRFRPSPITRQRLAAGLLGRKSGRGFYRYDGETAAPQAPPPTRRSATVWIAPGDGAAEVAAIVAHLGATIDTGERPASGSLCLLLPLGEDATTAALRHGLDGRHCVAVDPLFGLDSHRTLMTTPVTDPAVRDAAHGLLTADGVPATVVRDSPGFVAQRVVATIVNIACDIAQQRIATPEDIDRAVTLGLGYPCGPLAWGDRLGPGRVLRILTAMQEVTGDPRYRPSLWLRRRAGLGVSLLTDE